MQSNCEAAWSITAISKYRKKIIRIFAFLTDAMTGKKYVTLLFLKARALQFMDLAKTDYIKRQPYGRKGAFADIKLGDKLAKSIKRHALALYFIL